MGILYQTSTNIDQVGSSSIWVGFKRKNMPLDVTRRIVVVEMRVELTRDGGRPKPESNQTQP
jgi:hypothetical protein